MYILHSGWKEVKSYTQLFYFLNYDKHSKTGYRDKTIVDRTPSYNGLIWFSFTVKLLLGPGKVYNYFGGGYLQPSHVFSPLDQNYVLSIFIFFIYET